MILTNNQLVEAKKIYEIYWDSYTKGDLESFASTLDEEYEMIGTSESEVAHNKAEGIDFFKAQMEEVGGKSEMRNRQISAKPLNEMVLINETCDIFVLGKSEWTFYSKIRISTLLHETSSGWKIIQQHGSLPDMRVQEGETLALEKISKENLELRDAVKRRTAELENKNRELAIEAALEKVRAVAMGMTKPEDMLDVCRAISDQLQGFGVDKIRNVQIAIIDENIGQYLCYQYFTPYDKIAVEKTEYLKSPVEHGMVKQMLASRDGYFIGRLTGQELDAFRSHRKEENHFLDPLLDEATELDYCFLSIGEGGLGLTLYQPMADDNLTLFKRFHQVFSLAYQRFLDIQKAEEQAREAQIEASLERVRAQTMAMHSSEDVGKCVVKMFSELTALGVDEGTRFGIGILNQDNENNQLWTARKNGDEVNMHIGNIDMASHPLLKSARKAWKELLPLHRYVLEGEDLLDYYQMLNNAPDYKILVPIEKLPEREFHYGFVFEHGFFYAFSPREFQPDLIHITKRFSSLFEQTYRRYLDLVRAEAQAREAEIELALERVRARTMAMHHTEELKEVIQVVFDQFVGLNIHVEHAGFILDYKEREDMHIWLADHQLGVPTEITIPYFDSPHWNSYLDAKAKEESFFANFLPFEVKNKFYRDLFELIPELTEEAQQAIFSKPALAISTVLLDNVGLYIEHYSENAFSAEENAILMRFGKVFEQTYARFLDLQKAEAQAREAQIEAALERVRSRTMAMHQSEDLAEASTVLFEQLVELGVEIRRVGFALPDDEKQEFAIWSTVRDDQGKARLLSAFLHYDQHPIYPLMIEYWHAGKKIFGFELHGPDLQEYYKAWNKTFKTPDSLLKTIKENESEYYQFASFKQGLIYAFSGAALSKEEHLLLSRFAKAFEMTYTRFLDLKKAEAQAREAQIEASLEKVRSRSLAMHKSGELKEVVSVLFEKLKDLQIPFTAVGIATKIEGSKDLNAFVCGQNEAGLVITNYRLPYFDNPVPKDLYGAIEKQLDYFVGHYSKEEKDTFYEYVIEHTDEFRHLPEDIKRMIFDSTNYTISMVAVKNAVFNVNDFEGKVLAENEIDIIQRFARVFDQAYTRFLDLQKAEIQAREAQIEAGLERVRSRAMAMHSSQELKEVALELRKQMGLLGQKDLEVCAIHLYGDDKDSFESWSAMKSPDSETEIVQTQANFPKKGIRIVDELMQHYSSGTMDYILVNDGEKIAEWFKVMENNAPELHASIMFSIGKVPVNKLKANWSVSDFSGGALVMVTYGEPDASSRNLLRRSANVFEQAYIRFLDLKKAEAQAREAQIEAALERVRSRSLAMHKTDELQEVVRVVAEELKNTGIILDTWGAVICTYFEDSKDVLHWTASEDPANPSIAFLLPYFKDALFDEAWESKERGDSYFAKVFSFEVKNAFFNHAFEHSDYRQLPDGYKKQILESETHGIAWAWAKNSAIMIPSIQGDLPSEDEKEILIRFARVFEQSFIRFLDLQKAEAQAREAQIEAALEKVRSRSMAMHKSEELAEVSLILFEQVEKLGIKTWSTGFNVWLEDDTSYIDWVVNSASGKFLEPYKVDLTAHPSFMEISSAKKQGDDFFVHQTEGETLEELYRLLSQMAKTQFEDIVKAGFQLPEHQINHYVFGSKVSLMFITFDPCPEAHDIFKRFGKVFEQTYTRFLDLQRAEAQARESQIQLALERVRARTMAMQHSDELMETSELMFEQIKNLGIELWSCGFSLWYDDDSYFLGYNPGPHGKLGNPLKIPLTEDLFFTTIREAKRRGDEFLVFESEGESLVETYRYMDGLPVVGETMRGFVEAGFPLPTFQVTHCGFFSNGHLMFITQESNSEAVDIFKRFTKVFNQTYTRFLDLQKAEEQVREAQIEAALEKVRSSSLAMHNSGQIREIVKVVFEKLKELKFAIDGGVFVGTMSNNSDHVNFWIGDDHVEYPNSFKIPNYDAPTITDVWDAKKSGVEFISKTYSLIEKNIWFEYAFNHTDFKNALPEDFKKWILEQEYLTQSFAMQKNSLIGVHFHHAKTLTENEIDILKRFSRVFEQSYVRFLDLQKAESQAREAEIQLALERVRARSLAMHRSEELADISLELVKQIHTLGMESWFCAFNIYDDDPRGSVEWGSNGQGTFPQYRTPREGVFLRYFEAGQRGETLLVNEIGEEACPAHYEYLCSLPGVGEQLLQMKAAGIPFPTSQIDHVAFFKYGYVLFITYEPAPEAHDIFKRFANVFEQSYTRFLDLQKAENQAREAKVEAALEKVRSRTMGMQSSEELPEVANLLFTEVRSLGIPAWSCGYNILAEDKKTATAWMSSEGIMQTPFQLRLFGEASFDEMGEFILSDHTMFVQELGGKALEDHYVYMKTFPDLKSTFENIEAKGISLPTFQINHLCKFTSGFLLFITYEPVPDAHGIFKRFTSVFDQTYTRFLDLKKAEAQTREAQIENALEKVRSRSLAMQDPEELTEVAQLLREEMGALGVEELETSSIYIHDESSGLTQCWFTIKNPDNPDKAITDQMVIDLQDTWVGRKMDEFYQSKAKQTSILMQGEERIEWIRYCEEKSVLFGTSNFYGENIPDRTYHLYKFSNGYIGAAAPGEISSESWELLKRATAVFSFAYTRFRDLQMAQASARTAMRQASLDRVRADISSMRNADDLDRITPLIFKELTVLGVPFIRCGVFIIQEKQKIVEAYLSSPEGNSLGVLRLPYKASELTYQTVEAWRKGKVYRQHWNKEDFIHWINQLMKEDQIQDGSTYQGTAVPPESLDLHFVPFTQGMLYVGGVNPLQENELELVQALAKAFSIAYARYEDFVKLEQAKAKVESAMSELKATQSQLVQQEKLASLGQLTAGIAHEIKNPLNFVNNFSEVSIELVDEAIEERSKSQETRDETLLDEILVDIKSNLKKVHEHGSRANGIVTSMLQHSRGGSGKFEPTDLNALVKEYVNLSYHGMRAGKNPIDVEISFDLDPGITDVPIIKEDFIRVIINLCNNAFDAMRGKVSKTQDARHKMQDGAVIDESYLPNLKVTTSLKNGQVRMAIQDNGPGIPDEIKDKILQPFFTTKKGTEGTGLGLSITNDIIKAHGGELKIESEIEKGTTFIIELPIV